MLVNNKLFQGLVCGVIGCIAVPAINPSLLAGGGSRDLGITKVDSQENLEVKKPKGEKFVKLLLAGNSHSDGLVAELSKGNEESKWKVEKVTLRGSQWKNNWILYSNNIDGEYTFTDKSIYEHKKGCWGYAHYWGTNKVCASYGNVVQKDKAKWEKDFPKIKFEGWVTFFGNHGYSPQPALYKLNRCSVNVIEKKLKEEDSLVGYVSCADGTLAKKLLSIADLEKMGGKGS